MTRLRMLVAAVFAVAVAFTAVSIAVTDPSRELPAFVFTPLVSLGGDGVLSGQSLSLADFHEAGLPDAFRYVYRNRSSEGLSGLTVELYYFRSGNAEPRTLFGKFSRPAKERVASSLQYKSDKVGYIWLEQKYSDERLLGSRMSPRGETAVTRTEVWRQRFRDLRKNPFHLVRWLFNSDQLVDRRALWIEMHIPPAADSGDLPVEKIWCSVLNEFSQRLRSQLLKLNES